MTCTYATTSQSHLAKQSLENTNFDSLSPLSAEVISRQATINVGTVGHVAHGKSTVVKSLSGVNTAKFGKEKQNNMTIRLGYANAKIYECDNPKCPRPERYCSGPSSKKDIFPCTRSGCNGQRRLIRHISFVDCPGHETYMAAMLNGAAVMDAAILMIAANEDCPRPQTAEHLAAVDIMKLNSIIILQSKIDLIDQVQSEIHYGEIKKFIQDTSAKDAPIIPISAQFNSNIDVLCDYLARKIPVPIRDFTSKPRMTIIRSFDVNKPGTDVSTLKGGIVGGSISKGIFKINQEIEIRPGLVLKGNNGQFQCYPFRSKIASLYAEQNELAYAIPGGLIGVGTKIDPTACRADRLVGHVLGEIGTLPKIYEEIVINYVLFRHLIGVQRNPTQRDTRVSKLVENEILLINVGSSSTGGRVLGVRHDAVKLQLTKPICAEISEKVAISRRINGYHRLIGWGNIRTGKEIEPSYIM